MIFYLSKLIEFILLPSNVIGLLGFLGVLGILIGRRRLGLSLLVFSTILLIIGGWSPLGPAMLTVLENRFPKPNVEGSVDGIIMLGGAVNTHLTSDRGGAALNDAGERLTATVELSRRYPAARIFLSGGASDVASAEPVTESAVARNLLIAMGVAAGRIEMEERSRTTCENARESAATLRPKPDELWLLVTSASQMPRAVACFRASDFPVVPYPVDYRTRAAADLGRAVGSIGDGLHALDLAAHEWMGLVTYRLFGFTKELLPSP